MTDAVVTQLATVAFCSEISPADAGAEITQFAMVAFCVEFLLPSIMTPFAVPGFMQTMPYWLGEF